MTPETKFRSTQLTEGEAAKLRPGTRRREKSLADCVERHWKELFPELTYLGSEQSLELTLGTCRLDALAMDDRGSPVVLEYKANRQPSGKIRPCRPICQGEDYIRLLNENRDVLPNKEFNWSQPRLICIAEGFPGIEQSDLRCPSCSIELWVWQVSNQNALVLTRQDPPREEGDPRKERFGLLFGDLARQHSGMEGLHCYGEEYWRVPVGGVLNLFWTFAVYVKDSWVYLEAGRFEKRTSSNIPLLNQKVFDFFDDPVRKKRIERRLKCADLNCWKRSKGKNSWTQLGFTMTGGLNRHREEWRELIGRLLDVQKDLAQGFGPEFPELKQSLE